ncbi:hypothetical protein ATANTOWER_000316 [Ataeniobius toweri]|uniref:Uncharacterized protein n=1 Tax=Ataeniobius toweri TaxID=208326 RepID=A0ABU7A3I5_9TELE|nr:hypothetical protein [Ataeniobius toweri]
MFCQCHPSNTTNLSISDSESYSPSPDLHLHYQICSSRSQCRTLSTSKVTIDLLAASQLNVLLAKPVSSGGHRCLGRSAVDVQGLGYYFRT